MRDVLVAQVGAFEADVLDDAFQDRVQPAGADVLRRCGSPRRRCRPAASMPSGVNSSVTPSVASSSAYCLVSECFGSVRMRRKSALVRSVSSTRIGNRPCSSGIRSDGLDRVKRPGRDEQDVVGPHRAVARVDRRAFDDRQQVALHALAGDVGPVARRWAADLVQLVEEDDPLVLDQFDGLFGDRLRGRSGPRSPARAGPCGPR